MKAIRHYTHLFLTILTLLSLAGGCSQADEAITDPPTNGAISVSIRDASGAITQVAEGVSLGLTVDNTEEGEYADINIPYILRNGMLVPNPTPITVPEETVRLCVYGPYSSFENFILYPNRPPFYTVGLNMGVELDQRTQGTASSDLVWGEIADFKGTGVANNVVLSHKFSKIKIKLTSELGNDLSDAKVTLTGMFTGGQLKFNTGAFVVSTAMTQDVTAYRNEDGTFEAIMPEQGMGEIRIETGGKSYTFRGAAGKKVLAGTEHTFDVKVKDKGDLPFQIAVTYDKNKTLGDKLAVGARETTYDITMTEIPNSGNPVSFTYLKIRNADGGACWAHLGNTHSLTTDVIYHNVLYSYIQFEENLSPSPRSMTLEFYNTTDSKFVHKRVLIEQAGTSSYLTLSSPTLTVDKWGNKYDVPQALSVQCNQALTMENSNPDWVRVEGYAAGNRNQELRITVDKNDTGASREAKLRFVAADLTEKSYLITQTTAENATFTLKYDLNLDYSTTNNWFRHTFTGLGELYAGHITIFAKFEPNPDTAAEINTEATYGYVTDAPGSANKLIVTDFSSPYFIYPGYSGVARTLSGINSSILSSKDNALQSLFRQIMFDLPIPAKVRRDQKVKYTVTIKNIAEGNTHDKATVSYEIINQ